MGISFAYFIVVIYNRETQALEFLLESCLDKIMGSSVSSSSIMLTVEPVIAVKVMVLSTWAHRRGFQEGWNGKA